MNALPRRLGGHAEVYHRAWLSVCLQIHNPQNSNKEIGTFFENIDNHNAPSLDLTSSSMSSSITSAPTTPNGDDSCFYSNSDMDSDVSRDTLTDRSQSNGGDVSVEKRVVIKNDILSHAKSHSGRGKSPPLKRTIDSGVASSGDQSNKKRSMSTSSDNDMPLEEPVHNGNDSGMTIKELVEVVKTKGRRGLYQEYAYIKGEPPNGSFEISK